MKRAGVIMTGGLALAISIGCQGRTDDRSVVEEDNEFEIAEATPVEKTGCLTANGDRFALSAVGTSGTAETELYQLVGQEDELRKHVGREVRVTGEAEPPRVADVREIGPGREVGTSGEAGGDAEVRTESRTRLESRQMRVSSVTPTGDACEGERQK